MTIHPAAPLAWGKQYKVHIESGAITDVHGQVYAGLTGGHALPFTTGYVLGQSRISLGANNGYLMAPVQVEGQWYYTWDRNGDGVMTAPEDSMLMDTLEGLAFGTSAGTVFTESNRAFAIYGVQVLLPTDGVRDSTSNPATGMRPGTAWSRNTSGWGSNRN